MSTVFRAQTMKGISDQRMKVQTEDIMAVVDVAGVDMDIVVKLDEDRLTDEVEVEVEVEMTELMMNAGVGEIVQVKVARVADKARGFEIVDDEMHVE